MTSKYKFYLLLLLDEPLSLVKSNPDDVVSLEVKSVSVVSGAVELKVEDEGLCVEDEGSF